MQVGEALKASGKLGRNEVVAGVNGTQNVPWFLCECGEGRTNERMLAFGMNVPFVVVLLFLFFYPVCVCLHVGFLFLQ